MSQLKSFQKGKKKEFVCLPLASPPILAFLVGGPSGSPSEVAISAHQGYHIGGTKLFTVFSQIFSTIFTARRHFGC